MFLNDIGKPTDASFKRINHHLESNYGFRISEDVSDKDLVSIMEQIQNEITELKIKGDDSKSSPEISKRLLVLEGMKTLREFSVMNLQSPKLDYVVNNLVDFVVDTFEISGMQATDFDRAVQNAMDEYRSSRYRFPDDAIEHRVRNESMRKIQADAAGAEDKMSSAPVEIAALPDDSSVAKVPTSPMTPPQQNMPPMVSENRKGTVMKEKANLVKNLRYLLETEVSQAEVMMAAKGFAQELQEMVEKIGRLQNEDLPPVTDQMRETYGMESASAFQTQIYGALQSVMDALYTAKGQVDDAVTNMATTGQFNASTDMDLPVDGMEDPLAMDGEADLNADLDNLAGDAEAEDEFGGAEEEEPLGRAMKESTLQRKVLEMKKLVAKAKKLKEAKS